MSSSGPAQPLETEEGRRLRARIHSPFPADVAFAVEPVLADGRAEQCRLIAPETEYSNEIRNDRRRAEFIAGRIAARGALASMQTALKDSPIPRSSRGIPIWPEGITGTISHTEFVAAAAVASADRYLGLGLDLEMSTRVISDRVADHICLAEERTWIDAHESLRSERLLALFSAKEALYKAVHPRWGVFLAFKDACLTYDQATSSFYAELLRVRVERETLPVPEAIRTLRIVSLRVARDPGCAVSHPLIVSGCTIAVDR